MNNDPIQMLLDGISAQGRQERAEGGQWSIRELIAALSHLPDDADLVVDYFGATGGFECVNSYRGYYDELAIVPSVEPTNVRALRQALERAVGTTYEGYKGGDYTMTGATPVWVSPYGTASGAMVVGVEFNDGAARVLIEYRSEF